MNNATITWNAPSKDSSGSMPLGNGEIGINLWVEEDGDLLFYISRTDAWSENGRLLKLGRVRVQFSPNPFLKAKPFIQTLNVDAGAVEIRAGDADFAIEAQVWADANHPAIRVEADGTKPFHIRISLEIWRKQERRLEGLETFSAYELSGGPHPIIVYPDTVMENQRDRIVWFHRNRHSFWKGSMEHQGLGPLILEFSDPLMNRTFGGLIRGHGLKSESATALKSAAPRNHHAISIFTLTQQTETENVWVQEIENVAERVERLPERERRAAHEAWWRDFWNRSWVRLTSGPEAETVNRGYKLQRFISACAGRGAFPIKFNGSIFTVDSREKDECFDADYRRWGGPYWFQNTRLAYWPMLASGDFDLMQPLFRMFMNVLLFAERRTSLYFGHAGAFFPETMTFWGAYADSNYGWDRSGKYVSHCDNTYIRWYWTGQLELAAIMLDHYSLTQDAAFARNVLLPFAASALRFFAGHFPRDGQGKLLLTPCQSLETWQSATNPLPDIVGLQFVLDGLLVLPPELLSEPFRKEWQQLRDEVPPFPMKEEGGQTFLLPAKEFSKLKNAENPELYAVFPFRHYGLGKPGIEIGRSTFARRLQKRTGGWTQDAIQAALLGLTDDARRDVVQNFSTHHPGSRFPAFWGPNYDWIPDQDHGCVAIMALQTMLMQWKGDKILLFPAWPKDWDVEFKLHAPKRAIVEGIFEGGQLKELKVTPEERVKDVVVMGALGEKRE